MRYFPARPCAAGHGKGAVAASQEHLATIELPLAEELLYQVFQYDWGEAWRVASQIDKGRLVAHDFLYELERFQ